MTELEAIKRLAFTIGKQNKPNQTDADAINKIIEFFNTSNKKAFDNNLIFSKMYLFIIKEFAQHYNSIDIANKILIKELVHPLNYHLEILKDKLNTIELNELFKQSGIIENWQPGQKFTQVKEITNKNKEVLKNVSESEIKEVAETWDINSVIANANYTINQIINAHNGFDTTN